MFSRTSFSERSIHGELLRLEENRGEDIHRDSEGHPEDSQDGLFHFRYPLYGNPEHRRLRDEF